WTVIGAELETVNNIFIDKDIEPGVSYIYAVDIEDMHRQRSRLSMQIQAQIKANVSCMAREIPVKFISEPGAVIDLPTIILNRKNMFIFEEMIANSNFKIIPKTTYAEIEKDFIIKVTSLDNRKSKNIKLTLKTEPAQEVNVPTLIVGGEGSGISNEVIAAGLL
ncbi:unnamed protein product, partial [marine sediment metagenome]